MCCGGGGFEPRPQLTPRPWPVYSVAMEPTTASGTASLLPLVPAARELMEVLWRAPGPRSTRAVHDAIARRYPARAGRAIQTTSTLLTVLMEQGWVVGWKRGGTRWVYEPAVSRGEGLRQLAEQAVEAFCLIEPGDRWFLVRAALGRLEFDEPGGAPARAPHHQPKSAAPQPLSDPPVA